MAQQHTEQASEPALGPEPGGRRSAGCDRGEDGGHRHHGGHGRHHHHRGAMWGRRGAGLTADSPDARLIRGGRRRRPRPDEGGAPSRGRRFGPHHAPRGRRDGGPLRPLITAVRQLGFAGDDAQRESARVVLEQATRAIWSILAGGPTVDASEPKEAAATAAAPGAEGVPDSTRSDGAAGDPPDGATKA